MYLISLITVGEEGRGKKEWERKGGEREEEKREEGGVGRRRKGRWREKKKWDDTFKTTTTKNKEHGKKHFLPLTSTKAKIVISTAFVNIFTPVRKRCPGSVQTFSRQQAFLSILKR